MRLRQFNYFWIVNVLAILIALNNMKAVAVASASENVDSSFQVHLPLVQGQKVTTAEGEGGWSMAGANPQRTSWVPEEIRGEVKALWYKPFEPFIPPRVQVIAAYDTLYISTSNGLYALDAGTGNEKWVYPTELPLGHSPTLYKGIAYVGGFDRKLHAIDALTGEGLWTFEAGAGFDTNPLVVEGKVFAGNRDGYFYAVYAEGSNAGQLAWKFKTGGPIHFSAAYDSNVLYFASDDSHAYALTAATGELVWKSPKLPGAGFHSWWPVIYKDQVVFAGSNNYRNGSILGGGALHNLDEEAVFPNREVDPAGTLVGPLGENSGDWAPGTPTIDASKPETTSNGSTKSITEYLEESPWRRTYFVLNRVTGEEYTSDFDGDGKPEYAPILWFGNKGNGNRYPPVIGGDGVLYQTNTYMSNPAIPGGQVSGWMYGTPFLSVITSDWGAHDEPHAYSAGGNLIYWNLCCDRQAGSIDISIPNTFFVERYLSGIRPPTGGPKGDREETYFGPHLNENLPGYNVRFYGSDATSYASFGNKNGVYGYHGDQNPPIPYQGRIYMHRSNAIIAFGVSGGNPTGLPMAEIVEAQESDQAFSNNEITDRLAAEIQKILEAGHLRPGYVNTGIFDVRAEFSCGEALVDYWHNPGDSIYTLIQALPYLPPDLQQQTVAYLQTEFESYPPFQIAHIGWQDGAAREVFDVPPEVTAAMENSPPRVSVNNFDGWNFPPHGFYALWKYAEKFGNAQALFDAGKAEFELPPSDAVLSEMPHVHNAFIAGYIGYLELEELAGYPASTDVQAELDRLLGLRAESFSKDAPEIYFEEFTKFYCRTLNVSRNFMYMVPELAQYLHDHAYEKVQAAIEEYEDIAPYWFVSKTEMAYAEGTISPLYDYNSLFLAKARILQQPPEELGKYLDIPAVAVGDLFYIQNLISLLESGPSQATDPTGEITPSPVDSAELAICFSIKYFCK
jgi:hypothetical protein